MAFITLQDMFNLWKKVADAVTGNRLQADVQLTGNSMEFYGKSTDVKPTAGIKIGASFLEIDTKKVFIYDGSVWVVL